MFGFMAMLATPVVKPELMVVFRWGMLKDGAMVLRCYWAEASRPVNSYSDRFLDCGFRSYSARPCESTLADRKDEKG